MSIIRGEKLSLSWNKLINAAAAVAAAAAAAARAARSRQRTPACASRQGAPRLTNSLLSPRCAHKLIHRTQGEASVLTSSIYDASPSKLKKKRELYNKIFLKYFKYKMFYLYSFLDF